MTAGRTAANNGASIIGLRFLNTIVILVAQEKKPAAGWRAMRTVLLTDYAWPDAALERAIVAAAGFAFAAGPSRAARRRSSRRSWRAIGQRRS
jgi:hypothetical protein